MKRMAQGLPGGASFMEDYTYHMEPGNELVLGAHMLEVCPSIASEKPRIEVHPLGIGGKADPARLMFDGRAGRAILATIVDMGDRFRLVVEDAEAVKPPETHAEAARGARNVEAPTEFDFQVRGMDHRGRRASLCAEL
jgi:L-arabinose isomerase